MFRRSIAVIGFAFLLSGCGGGSAGTAARTVPGSSASPVPLAAPASVRVRIGAAAGSPSGASRKPQYVSAGTKGAAFTVYPAGSPQPTSPTSVADLSPTSPNCAPQPDGSRICTIPISAPAGSDNFIVDLYDAPPVNGAVNGNRLGSGSAPAQNIAPGQANTVSFTVGGVISKLQLQPQNIPALANGVSQAFNVSVVLRDSAGYIIIGSDPLYNPVSFSVSNDASSTVQISPRTITTPATPVVAVTYNGGPLTSATLTAQTSDGIAGSTVIQPMSVAPGSLSLAAQTDVGTITVSDAGMSGYFTATSSDTKCATVTPAAGAPNSPGGQVTFQVKPVSSGSCSVTVLGRVPQVVPVAVNLQSVTVPIGGGKHWLIAPRSEQISVTETGYAGSFVATSGSCASVSPPSVPANNGAATFTVTAASSGQCNVTITGAQSHVIPYAIETDDWTMFGHDALHTGYQPASLGITPQNVSQMSLRWSFKGADAFIATPLVANGRVYVESLSGDVYSLDAKSGTLVWDTQPFGANHTSRGTPALHNGTLFLGQNYPVSTSMPFVALNAETGAVKWSQNLAGPARSSPVVANGVVYVGTAYGDAPYCYQGGVYALDEQTGAVLWHFVVDPTPNDGGSVWSPLAFDGVNVIFGTGNTCVNSVNAANSVVAVNAQTGQMAWVAPIFEPSTDDNDIGGGATVANGRVYVTSKNGNFYVLNQQTGAIIAKTATINSPGLGGIGTPSTDGTSVIASGGFRENPGTVGSYSSGGTLYGFDLSGRQKWLIGTGSHPIWGQSPTTGGVVFATLDSALTALDITNGTTLWSNTFYGGDYYYASPVVVQSGVYVASEFGFVLAYGFGDTRTPSAARHAAAKHSTFRPPPPPGGYPQ